MRAKLSFGKKEINVAPKCNPNWSVGTQKIFSEAG